MKKISLSKFILITCIAAALLHFPVRRANAIEALRYNDISTISISLKHQIDVFLKEQLSTASSLYEISSSDLNNDGILEHILKRKSCIAENEFCTHTIIAEQEEKIALIANIKASSLIVDTALSYGVKNLLAFKNKINDYDYDIYMWSPQKKMYILKKIKIRN